MPLLDKTSCSEMSHLSSERVYIKLHQTAQADWVEHAQQQKKVIYTTQNIVYCYIYAVPLYVSFAFLQVHLAQECTMSKLIYAR